MIDTFACVSAASFICGGLIGFFFIAVWNNWKNR